METKFNCFPQFAAVKQPLALQSQRMAQEPALPHTIQLILGNSSNFLSLQISHLQVEKLWCNAFSFPLQL